MITNLNVRLDGASDRYTPGEAFAFTLYPLKQKNKNKNMAASQLATAGNIEKINIDYNSYK